jgi:hypothetical protein
MWSDPNSPTARLSIRSNDDSDDDREVEPGPPLSSPLYKKFDIVEGPEYKLGYCTSLIDVAKLDNSQIVIGYNGYTQIATISGDEIVYGENLYCPVQAVAGLDSTHFVAIPSGGYAKTGAITNTGIKLSNDIQYNTGSTSRIAAESLDNSRYVVAYSEEGVGMAVVLSPSDSSFDDSADDDTSNDVVDDDSTNPDAGDDDITPDNSEDDVTDEASNSRLNLSGVFSLFKNRKTGFIGLIRQLFALLFRS